MHLNKTKKVTKKLPAQDIIFNEGSSWENDTIFMLRLSERKAWIIASAAGFFAMLGITVASYQLFRDPPPPVVLEVEKLTGRVQMLTSLSEEKSSYGEASDEHWAQMYLLYRLSYLPDAMSEFYRYVGYMSSESEQEIYHKWFQPNDNPTSPLNLYGKNGRVKLHIESISTLQKDKSIIIRYTKTFEGIASKQDETWQAIISYQYKQGAKMSKEARAINPFAWQATGFEEVPDGAMNSKTTEKAGKK